MQLKNFLSANQIDVLRKMPKASTKPISKDFLREQAFEFLREFLGNKCKEDFLNLLKREYQGICSAFVCLSGKHVDVLRAHESEIFAKHIGSLLKRGIKICWVRDGWASEISWDNWQETYKKLTAKCETNEIPVAPNRRELHEIWENRNRQKVFSESAETNRYKKLGKCGWNTTFNELKSEMKHQHRRELMTKYTFKCTD